MLNKSWLFKVATLIIISGLTVLVAMLVHMLNILDISQQPAYVLSAEQKKADFYLITYADGAEVYFQNRNALANSAVNRGFDFILNYRREHIDPEYIAQHPILNEKSGAGYWLWKPYLLLKTMQSVPDGAIISYVDSGLMFRQPMRTVLEQALATPGKDVALVKYDPIVTNGYAAKISSGDTFDALGCREERCRMGEHTMGGFVTVRNSPRSRAFIAEWLHHCENEDLIKGKNFKSANYPEFSHQQHDEAILSVLANRDVEVVNFIPADNGFYKYIHMHRRKTQDRSLLGYSNMQFIHAERRIPNSWWMRLVRK